MGISKALFIAENGVMFTAQFNPVNFKYDKPVSWKEHDEQGKESQLEFQKVQPATISMELLFDTTHDGGDVRSGWVNKLLMMTNPDVKDQNNDKERPPKVYFSWGSFFFEGVVESVNATYTMFSQQGNPLRAKVSLKMKEWVPESTYAMSGFGGGLDTSKVQLVTVQSGQTLAQIAAQAGVSMTALLSSNPQITNPLEISAGMVLSIHF